MKNKKNHTPGPWKIEGAAINDSEGTPLALCCSTEANAALIAAAPYMYEALKAIVARIMGEWDYPALVKFGPLSVSTETDCATIAAEALQVANGTIVGKPGK
jgi:hypothetical protein